MTNNLTKLVFATVLVVASILTASVSQAHETKYAGTIGVLLHLEPLDNPAVNEQAYLYFAFEDSTNQFQIVNSRSHVTVKSQGATLLEYDITAADYAPDWGANVARVPFVFPEKGIYQVSIQTQSTDGSFQDFALEYDRRIERESVNSSLAKNQQPNNLLLYYYWIGGGLLLFGIIIYVLRSSKKGKNDQIK